MRYQLPTSGILAAWETGVARQPLDRALAILWAAGADDDGHPADLSIAERDRRLLTVRANSFGPVMPARATCPDCGTEMEMDLNATDLAAALTPDDHLEAPLRPLTSRDLAAVAGLGPDAAAAALQVRFGEDGAEAGNIDRLIEEIAEASELTTRISCAECGQTWTETLDVPAHLWADISASAQLLLGEVAELAAAYGWSEDEILSLGPARRAVYLERARS